MPCWGQRPTTVFQVRPDPRIEVAVIFQALRAQASRVSLEPSKSGLLAFHILYTIGRTWLQGGLVNRGASCSITCLFKQIGHSWLIVFLLRMKIQGLTWETELMNGPNPEPQFDPLTSWSWLMLWVSKLLSLLILSSPASDVNSSIVQLRSLCRAYRHPGGPKPQRRWEGGLYAWSSWCFFSLRS